MKTAPIDSVLPYANESGIRKARSRKIAVVPRNEGEGTVVITELPFRDFVEKSGGQSVESEDIPDGIYVYWFPQQAKEVYAVLFQNWDDRS